MIARFRDAITGMFTRSREPSTTVAEAPSKPISAINRRILANALKDEALAPTATKGNQIMRTAITTVLASK